MLRPGPMKSWVSEFHFRPKKKILETFTPLLPDMEYILLTVTFLALKFPRHQRSTVVCFRSSGFQFNGISVQVPSSDID